MKEFFGFFLMTDSADRGWEVFALMALGILAAVLFTFLEYRFPQRAFLFVAANAMVTVVLFGVFLMIGAGLSELLLCLLFLLFVRLLFVFGKERGKS